MTKMKHQK